jgi:hypothetical protein
VLFGLIVDQIYTYWGISSQAMVGQASEVVPPWGQWLGAVIVLLLSVKPVYGFITARFKPVENARRVIPQPDTSKSESISTVSDCEPT